MINSSQLVAQGKTLLAQATRQKIPYSPNGMTLAGMDCQGLCEYLLIQCGLAKNEVNLAGSNAHWRKSLKWRGTVEEAVRLFGDIPEGAWVFIHTPGFNAKYGDTDGDASHMGQYLDGLKAVHASASRGMVCESEVKRRSISGGWNMVGLPKWVQFSAAVEARINGVQVDAEIVSEAPLPVTQAEPAQLQPGQAKVAGGKDLRLRRHPSADAPVIKGMPDGTVLVVLSRSGDWAQVRYIDRYKMLHIGWCKTEFLEFGE